MLEGIEEQLRFDTIYWNYPFHPSAKSSDENLHEIDVGIKDPGDNCLERLLQGAKTRLEPSGKILLSFSESIRSFPEMKKRAEKWGWQAQVVERREEIKELNQWSICVVEFQIQQEA